MKLHIFGASASGVTTLGQALSERLGIPYVDSDDYFWYKTEPPFTIRRNADERNTLITHDIGSMSDWILGARLSIGATICFLQLT